MKARSDGRSKLSGTMTEGEFTAAIARAQGENSPHVRHAPRSRSAVRPAVDAARARHARGGRRARSTNCSARCTNSTSRPARCSPTSPAGRCRCATAPTWPSTTRCARAAGLFDLSHMGEILVVGPEAAQALDYALAGKLSAIAEGQAKYSLLLARDGGILDDLVVYRTGDDRYLVVANASNRALVAEELRERCSIFDCLVEDEIRRHRADRAAGPDRRGDPAQRRGLRPAGARRAEVLPRDRRRLPRASTCWSPAPATPARTASSSTSRPSAPPSCGRR